jgi:hypothetical protein
MFYKLQYLNNYIFNLFKISTQFFSIIFLVPFSFTFLSMFFFYCFYIYFYFTQFIYLIIIPVCALLLIVEITKKKYREREGKLR